MPKLEPSKISGASPARGRQGVSIRDIITDLGRGWETVREESQFPQGSRAVGGECQGTVTEEVRKISKMSEYSRTIPPGVP